MDFFSLTEDQQAFVESARAFSQGALAPNAAEWDATSHFPVDVLKQAGEPGFMGMYTPEDAASLRTGDPGPKGISTLLIPADAEGISYGKNEEKMGWKAQPTCMISFDNVRVPAENLLGAEGQGFAADVGFNVCNDALQLFGGYGYIKESAAGRLLRSRPGDRAAG